MILFCFIVLFLCFVLSVGLFCFVLDNVSCALSCLTQNSLCRRGMTLNSSNLSAGSGPTLFCFGLYFCLFACFQYLVGPCAQSSYIISPFFFLGKLPKLSSDLEFSALAFQVAGIKSLCHQPFIKEIGGVLFCF